jgi:hypothetical protein
MEGPLRYLVHVAVKNAPSRVRSFRTLTGANLYADHHRRHGCTAIIYAPDSFMPPSISVKSRQSILSISIGYLTAAAIGAILAVGLILMPSG